MSKLQLELKSLGYIPSLDGLRAFAVILVMFAHANFIFFGNGGIGVSVFFVLSGFLITTLLLEEFEKHKQISFKAFYVRRIFRLFPALYTFLFFTFIYAFFFNLEMFYKILPEIIISGLYVYNLSWIWQVKDFMLYHTWSLGVEEQFYFMWPLVLLILLKYSTLKIITNLLILFIFFILINTTFTTHHNFFFHLINSIFNVSIFIGCLAAILRMRGVLNFKIPSSLAILCLVLIVTISLLPNRIIGAFYSFRNELTGLFAVVIIWYLIYNKDGVLHKVFENCFMVFMGKISYGLYLWHLLVFKIFSIHFSLLPHKIYFISQFIVSFILALLSWFIIEKNAIKIGHRLSSKINHKRNLIT